MNSFTLGVTIGLLVILLLEVSSIEAAVEEQTEYVCEIRDLMFGNELKPCDEVGKP